MKEIPLTRGYVAIVNDTDFENLNKFKWYAKKDGNNIYAARTFGTKFQKNQQTLRMHRIILNASSHLEVDHIDGNGLNNQRLNIRLVTRRQNQQNLHIVKSSKFSGVTLIKSTGHWQAQIKIRGYKIYLGNFKTEEEAHAKYLEKLQVCNSMLIT